jgi:hypothetical protein
MADPLPLDKAKIFDTQKWYGIKLKLIFSLKNYLISRMEYSLRFLCSVAAIPVSYTDSVLVFACHLCGVAVALTTAAVDVVDVSVGAGLYYVLVVGGDVKALVIADESLVVIATSFFCYCVSF